MIALSINSPFHHFTAKQFCIVNVLNFYIRLIRFVFLNGLIVRRGLLTWLLVSLNLNGNKIEKSSKTNTYAGKNCSQRHHGAVDINHIATKSHIRA